MADSANPADGRPSPPSASSDANAAAPRPATGGPTEKLPLLTFLGRQNLRSAGADGGIVGALIVGSLGLVVALMALTIAIGRAPQDVSANPGVITASAASASPTTFVSPEQTGIRWTAQPIITGVPQKPPYNPPAPSTKAPARSSAAEAAPTTAAAVPGPPGQTRNP